MRTMSLNLVRHGKILRGQAVAANRTWENRLSGMRGGLAETLTMGNWEPAAQPKGCGSETLRLKSGAPLFYPTRPIFGMDRFDRLFLPAMQTYTVNVLDCNGNLVARLGGYGNADSPGGDSIGLRWAPFVAVSDDAMFVMDIGTRRVLRCALDYAVIETVPLY